MFLHTKRFSGCFAVLFLFLCSFPGSLLFGKAPERVQIMKKVNRNNRAIDVTTVGGRIKKLRTEMGMSQEKLGFALHMEGKSFIYGYE